MTHRVWCRSPQVVALGFTLALGLFVATGCGSSGSSSSSNGGQSSGGKSAVDVAAAKAAYTKDLGVPTYQAVGPAFNASKARGKLIWAIPINSALPYQKAIDQGMTEAATAAGVRLQFFSNQGTVNEWVTGIQQGIARKADLIMLDAAPNPAQLQPQIKQARAAGVPIIATNMPTADQFPPNSLSPNNVSNLTAVTEGPYGVPPRLDADYAIANSPAGKVNALVVVANEVASSLGMQKSVVNEFRQRCGDQCHTTVLNVPLVDWATKMQGEVQNALAMDPSINWVIPIYDSMSEFVVPGIAAAGKAGRVHVATYNGTPFVLKTMQQSGAVSMDVGNSLDQVGWAAMDQALRLLSGTRPVMYQQSAVPLRAWTHANIGEAGKPPQAALGYGTQYKDGYLKLWGLK